MEYCTRKCISNHRMVRIDRWKDYLPFAYFVFFFVIIANFNGNDPYGITITTSSMVSTDLSVMISLRVTIPGLLKTWSALLFQRLRITRDSSSASLLLVFIITTSYFARAVSPGIRLFANMVSGHTLLIISSTFLYQLFTSSVIIFFVNLISFAIFVALIKLEIAVNYPNLRMYSQSFQLYVHI